jgi:hypothetical protein
LEANLRASIIAAFLSLSVSKAKVYDNPFLACQKTALAAALPPPRLPHNCKLVNKACYQKINQL